MKNESKTEELTFRRIKDLGPDEPSADFTQKVMQSVLSENLQAYAPRRRRHLWLIGLIPAILIISWGIITILQRTEYIDRLRASIKEVIQPFLDSFLLIIVHIKTLSIHPTILISFTVILSLLIVEEFFSSMKQPA
ncbi:MAG: hypothetical protein JW973_14980 [Bacteroidales bacterium]|nr:hypothetical protein [Bacteroidales bacterium]